MKEQIVEMSGLSPRVIRVWFQNKRCKDKKTQIKKEMQQERVGNHSVRTYFPFDFDSGVNCFILLLGSLQTVVRKWN